MKNEKPKMVEGVTDARDGWAIGIVQRAVQSVQQITGHDSVTYAALLGIALGEMLAVADKGSEERMDLPEDLSEMLKSTLMTNFEAAYNRIRSELELQTKIQPKKGVI